MVDIGSWDTGPTATIGDYGVLGGTAAVIAGGYLAAGPTVAGLIGATLAEVGGLTVDAAVGGPISQSAMSVIDTSQMASQLAADPAAFGQSLGMFGSSAADVAAAGTVANDGTYLYAFAGSQ